MAQYSVESVLGREHVQTVYRGKDNPIEVLLKKDDADYNFGAARMLRVKIGTTEFDNASDPGAFDVTESEIGKLRVFIGQLPGIPAQSHNVKIEVIDDAGRTLYFGHVRVRIDDAGI